MKRTSRADPPVLQPPKCLASGASPAEAHAHASRPPPSTAHMPVGVLPCAAAHALPQPPSRAGAHFERGRALLAVCPCGRSLTVRPARPLSQATKRARNDATAAVLFGEHFLPGERAVQQRIESCYDCTPEQLERARASRARGSRCARSQDARSSRPRSRTSASRSCSASMSRRSRPSCPSSTSTSCS